MAVSAAWLGRFVRVRSSYYAGCEMQDGNIPCAVIQFPYIVRRFTDGGDNRTFALPLWRAVRASADLGILG